MHVPSAPPLQALNLSPTPASLLKDLAALEKTVQSRIEADNSFRKANASFNIQSETTQLLLAACEKLVVEKGAMDRASFEEHTSELAYLCKHFGTAINTGLSERYHRDKLMQMQPWSSVNSNSGSKKQRARWFAFCCQMDFPPQQSWWIDASQRLAPDYQVLRAGKITSASASDLVPGDILFLHAGQRAAADGRVLVFAEGTAFDVSHLTMELSDVRICSAEATTAAITASNNMVLKDSYLVSGAVFCMVVRAPSSSLIPSPVGTEEERPFLQDATVPAGMTPSQCRSLFKQLCVKARLVCRTFKAMVTLARVPVLVVMLTQDLIDAGTVTKLVTVTKRLSKGLVLVDCGCGKDAVTSLCQEHGLEHMDLASTPDGADANGSGMDRSATEDMVTPTGTTSVPHFVSPTSSEMWQLQFDGRQLQNFSTGERPRLAFFAEALLARRLAGGVMSNLSQAGLTALCAILTDSGSAPLYAMGPFHYPACFKQIVLNPARALGLAGARPRTTTAGGSQIVGPQISMAGSEPSIVPTREHRTTATTNTPKTTLDPMSPKAGEVAAAGMSFSRMASTASQATSLGARLSSGELDVSKLDIGKCSEIVVSLNSIGVVSEHADCVLLKSDLGCLAQALEMTAKSIPPAAISAAGGPLRA